MKGSKDFKPCDELIPSDFEMYPVWTFDLSRAEEEPEADETWVRPIIFQKLPRNSDVLFLRANLKTAEGSMMPGALLVRFERGKPQIQALALLQPQYLALDLDVNKVADGAKIELEKVDPKFLKWFPIIYKAVLPVGTKEILFSGQAE